MTSILAIDNESDVRDCIRTAFLSQGFEVRTAEDGLVGLKEFFKQPADIVIVEIFIPHLNGIEVIKRIRSDCPHARIIAVTGGGKFDAQRYRPGTVVMDAFRALAMRAGADAMVTKPLNLEDLLSMVRGFDLS